MKTVDFRKLLLLYRPGYTGKDQLRAVTQLISMNGRNLMFRGQLQVRRGVFRVVHLLDPTAHHFHDLTLLQLTRSSSHFMAWRVIVYRLMPLRL